MRCFLIGRDHLILPAFGTYTGGLLADDPVLRKLVPDGLAVACGTRALPLRLDLATKKAGTARRRPFGIRY